jgi:hypothetical protein
MGGIRLLRRPPTERALTALPPFESERVMRPDLFQLNAELSQAVRDVANGERIVAEQETRIKRLMAVGGATARAENSLRLFIETLNLLRSHELLLRREVAETQP